MPGEADLTQEYWMYFKENWQSMAEKDPPIGRVDNFQTGLSTHFHMSMHDRAAQFMPFRALTGYEDAVQETARLIEDKAERTEDEKSILNRKLQELADRIDVHPQVTLTYFQPDKKKAGGAYIGVIGQLRRIDDLKGVLILMDGKRILIEDILDIQ